MKYHINHLRDESHFVHAASFNEMLIFGRKTFNLHLGNNFYMMVNYLNYDNLNFTRGLLHEYFVYVFFHSFHPVWIIGRAGVCKEFATEIHQFNWSILPKADWKETWGAHLRVNSWSTFGGLSMLKRKIWKLCRHGNATNIVLSHSTLQMMSLVVMLFISVLQLVWN